MAAIPKKMSIKTACRLLRCANDNQLAHRLGAQQGTIGYWKKQGGMVPALWRDRVELILRREEEFRLGNIAANIPPPQAAQ